MLSCYFDISTWVRPSDGACDVATDTAPSRPTVTEQLVAATPALVKVATLLSFQATTTQHTQVRPMLNLYTAWLHWRIPLSVLLPHKVTTGNNPRTDLIRLSWLAGFNHYRCYNISSCPSPLVGLSSHHCSSLHDTSVALALGVRNLQQDALPWSQ